MGKLQESAEMIFQCQFGCGFSQKPECEIHASWDEYRPLFRKFRKNNRGKYPLELVYVHAKTKNEKRVIRQL